MHTNLYKHLWQDVELVADDRRTHVVGITRELFRKDKSIKILDVGAGTGIAGQMVRTQFVNWI